MEVISIVLTVLAASLLGSLHCVLMCGPIFVAMKPSRGAVISYQMGRFASYMSLGAMAGALGSVAFSRFLASDSGIIATFLSSAYFVAAGFRLVTGRGLQPVGYISRQLHSFASFGSRSLGRLKSEVLRGLGIGFITGFLPCGWLYLFVGAALAMGQVSHGAVLLLTFWLGTLPIFMVLGQVKARIIGQQRKIGNVAAGCLLILLGVFLPLLKLTSFAHRLGESVTENQAFLIDGMTGGQASLILPEGLCRKKP